MPIRHKGTAIITALFIMALCAIIATSIYWQVRININRTESMQEQSQIIQALNATQGWALNLIIEAAEANLNNPNDQLPQQFPSTNMNGVLITATLADAQQFFNINDLLQADAAQAFLNLISIVSPTTNQAQAQTLVNQIQLYLTYGKNKNLQSYSAAINNKPNFLINSIDMLPTIVNSPLWQQLSPYIIALPETTALNINHLDATMLQIIGNSITAQQAQVMQQVIAESQPLNDINIFLQNPLIANLGISSDLITNKSNYFVLTTQTTTNNQSSNHLMIFKRQIDDKTIIVKTIYAK